MTWYCIDCGADRGNEPSGVCDCPGPRGHGSSSEWIEAFTTLTHKPGPGGLFAPGALCGADPSASASGVLRMHEWDYDCAVCAALAGEADNGVTP